jgi:hypothetical protein
MSCASRGRVLAVMTALLLGTVGAVADDVLVSTPLKVMAAYGVGGAVLWLAADSGVTLDHQGNVMVLDDRTGNFTLRPVHSGPSPSLVAKALNGRPVFRFDGNQTLYTADGFGDGLDRDMTFIIVSVANGVSMDQEYALYLGGNATTGANRAMAIYEGKEIFDGQFVASIGEPALKRVFTVSGISISPALTRASFYRNGKLITTAGLDPRNQGNKFASLSGEITMGAATMPVRGWYGDIAEELVYNHQLSAAEMQTIWSALSTKYDLHEAVAAPASAASSVKRPH